MALHVIFYENVSGEIQLPPTSDTPCPRGFITREANTLPEIDALQARMWQQIRDRDERALERDEAAFAEARRRVYSDLHAKLASSATTQYEKDFIREYLKLRPEKRAKYHSRFLCDRAYFTAREFDSGHTNEQIARSIGE